MTYLYALDRQDYTDFATGRVFYSLPGRTAFPVRLATEIFQRCLAYRTQRGLDRPCTLYDPCCGSAYLLATIAYLHRPHISSIIGSDIDHEVLPLAARNLALLTAEGLRRRIGDIQRLHNLYGKTSHADALVSAYRLLDTLGRQEVAQPVTSSLTTRLFVADATQTEQLRPHLASVTPDVIVADVPYGQQSHWQHDAQDATVLPGSPIWRLLDGLLPLLPEECVLALVSDKAQKVQHAGYRRVEQFQVGKRRIVLLAPIVRQE